MKYGKLIELLVEEANAQHEGCITERVIEKVIEDHPESKKILGIEEDE